MNEIKEHNSSVPRVLYTQKEIASMMGVSLVTVRRWQKLGCPVVRIGIKIGSHGCRTRLDAEKVKAWLESRSAACGNDTQKGGEA